jgi:aromatic-amino-acid transaminase
MLTKLEQQPADALLALIKLHDADPRADKIDLGVGVYRTGQGETPVFGAIKEAERILLDTQDSKAYLGPEGDMGFVRALMPYVFGKAAPDMQGRIEGMQTPGGTGSLRLALAMARRAGGKRIVVGNPTWPNHPQICKDLGLDVAVFNHARPDGTVDMEALREAIASGGPDDVLMLHGCCHNPSGIDYSEADWDEIAGLLARSPMLPLLDLAYQGLGQGMEADAYGLRRVLGAVPEALIAYSCDKNFGLYRDRVGALYVMAQDASQLGPMMSNAHALARANWSQPPDHGGAAVRIVLEDAALTAQWLDELDQMRERMNQMRARLAAAGTAGSINLAPMGAQNGLFSIVGLSADQVLAIREKHGVYMAGTSRINIAGLTSANIDKFIAAVADVSQ